VDRYDKTTENLIVNLDRRITYLENEKRKKIKADISLLIFAVFFILGFIGVSCGLF